MSSHPGPGIINIMIYHKHFASVLIYHPCGSRNMRNCIFSGKCVLIVPDPSQNQSFVLFFLFIEWGIVFYLSDGILTCHLVISLFSNSRSISCQSLHLTNLSLGSSARLFHGRSNTAVLQLSKCITCSNAAGESSTAKSKVML